MLPSELLHLKMLQRQDSGQIFTPSVLGIWKTVKRFSLMSKIIRESQEISVDIYCANFSLCGHRDKLLHFSRNVKLFAKPGLWQTVFPFIPTKQQQYSSSTSISCITNLNILFTILQLDHLLKAPQLMISHPGTIRYQLMVNF